MAKQYNDLTFTDDFMFCKILQNNQKIAKQLVEMILNIRIKRIVRIEAQRSIEDSIDSKGIRLDVYIEDDENTVYDIELQTYEDGDLIMRNRYYHSLIAVDNLNKGAMYSEMKRSYVIFICSYDPFKMGLPVYTARTRFDEKLGAVVDDGAVSVFLNCSSKDDSIGDDMRKFFKYIREKSPSKEGLTKSIENDLLEAKNQKKWRREYMTLYELTQRERKEAREEGRAEGLAEGLTEGRAEGREELAVKFIPELVKLGLPLEEACAKAEISVERYNEIKNLAIEN